MNERNTKGKTEKARGREGDRDRQKESRETEEGGRKEIFKECMSRGEKSFDVKKKYSYIEFATWDRDISSESVTTEQRTQS